MSTEFWRGRKCGSLDSLSDVATSGATDGQALVYDADTATWGPGSVASSTIDDAPSNGVTDHSISSNWAYDHAALTTAHGISSFGATLVDDADAATARGTLGIAQDLLVFQYLNYGAM